MDALMVKQRKERFKQEILESARPFVDAQTESINTKEFFNAFPYYANKIAYYFGSMENFYEDLGVRKKFKYIEKIKTRKYRSDATSVRNQLALERLDQLLNEGLSLVAIGQKFGVSRQAIYHLMATLDKDVE